MNKSANAEVLYSKAEKLRLGGKFRPAQSCYAKAAACAAPELKARALIGGAACLRTLGISKKAQESALAARRVALAHGFKELELDANMELAMALRAAGELRPALVLLNSLFGEYKAAGDIDACGFIHWARGGIYRLQGSFKLSAAEFCKSAQAAKRAHDKMALAYSYCGLAGVLRIAGDIAGCIKHYKLAERIFSRTTDTFGKAYTNCGLANGLRQAGKYDQAYRHYVKADKLYSAIGDKVDLGFVSWGKGNILLRQGRFGAALAQIRRAGSLFAGSDEERGSILALISLSQILYLTGKKEKAVKTYSAAMRRAVRAGLHTYLEILT